INGGEILRGIRTAKTSKSRIGRRSRIDWQQVKYPAAQRLENMRQGPCDVAQLPGRRNNREPLFVQFGELRFERSVVCRNRGLAIAEHAWKGTVNKIGGAVSTRMHGDAEVAALRPILMSGRV